MCGNNMGISLTSVVETTAQALGKEINGLCESIGAQTTYDPIQVGTFIDAGDFQGGVDPAATRELTFTLATGSTLLWRSGGKKSSTCINMAKEVAENLTLKKKVFTCKAPT